MSLNSALTRAWNLNLGCRGALYITITDLLLSLELKLLETMRLWHPLLPSLPLCNRSFHHYWWETEAVPAAAWATVSFLDYSLAELLMKMVRWMIPVRKDRTLHPVSQPARNKQNPSSAEDRKNGRLCRNASPRRVSWESRWMLQTPMMINQSITQH